MYKICVQKNDYSYLGVFGYFSANNCVILFFGFHLFCCCCCCCCFLRKLFPQSQDDQHFNKNSLISINENMSKLKLIIWFHFLT